MDVPCCPARIHQSPPPPPPFRFLDLPPEIRNNITYRVIVAEAPIVVRHPPYNRHPSPPPRQLLHPLLDGPTSRSPSPDARARSDLVVGHSRLALLMTCRELYCDNWRTYYGANTFLFTLKTFEHFRRSLPMRCLNQIRNVQFQMPYRSRHRYVWQGLGELKNLSDIQLWLSNSPSLHLTAGFACIEGAKQCRSLRSLSIKREVDAGSSVGKEILERDREIEEIINAYLRKRRNRVQLK